MKPTWQQYYDRSSELQLRNPWYREQVERYVLGALRSDAPTDLTSKKIIPRALRCRAVVRVKQAGVSAGIEEATWLLRREGLSVKTVVNDGTTVKRHQALLKIVGQARTILAAERTALNVIQRLSGIATLTAQCVAVVGRRPLLCATRKTLWGALDKRAVHCGGGYTHRLGLFDGLLVKDNHLALLEHDQLTHVRLGHGLASLEVSSLAELKRAIVHYPQFKILLLDNFSPDRLRLAVHFLQEQHLRHRYVLEASGGIKRETIALYAKTGVDVVSSGALTHSAPALDCSLDCIPL